ncbi:MAG: 4-(cytidine 5'-diphospho)-2-C-methyl-D-erythritol kinase, partial [Bradyrhizobium sp.]
MPAPLVENALAKVNLTLRVIGRRVDGYHDIESLVAFADFGDRLTFSPGDELKLSVHGPGAAQAGEDDDN